MDREECVFMAKLAEQAERYDEMVEEVRKIAKMVHDQQLSVEERNLLSVAYKNVIGSRRASWRIVSSIEQKEESKGNVEHVERIQKYRGVVSPLSRARARLTNRIPWRGFCGQGAKTKSSGTEGQRGIEHAQRRQPWEPASRGMSRGRGEPDGFLGSGG